MNWYSVFYWLTVADNFRTFFTVMIVIFTVISGLALLGYLINGGDRDYDAQRLSRKWLWWAAPIGIIFWMLFLFTPSKSDMLLIIAGGSVGNFITSDSSSQAIPSEITRFLHVKLQAEIAGADGELKKELGIQTEKEKFMDKVKDLTKEELLEYLKKDTTLIK